jgi:hypothetical protein
MCAQGIDRIRARAIFDAEVRALALTNEAVERLEQVVGEEATEEEEETEETDLDFQARIRESGIRDQKLRILAKIEKQVDDADKESEFLRAIENSPLFPAVKAFASCLVAFGKPKYADVAKIVCVMSRNGDKIEIHFEMLDSDNRYIMFDPKTGDVVKFVDGKE